MEKDNVEMGRLDTPDEENEEEMVEKEGAKDNHVGALEEEEEVEEDAKNEEQVSLLEGRITPLPNIITPCKTEVPRTSGTVVVLPSSNLMATQARLATPDPDIQLAEVEAPQCRTRRPTPSHLSQLSSIHTVCGPRPARITAACILVLSLWAAFMLLIHMNKKIDTLSSTLSLTNDKLKTMEEVNEDHKSQLMSRLHRMGRLIHSLRDPRQGKLHETDNLSQNPNLPSQTNSSPGLHPTSPPTQNEAEEDKGIWNFDDDWWSG